VFVHVPPQLPPECRYRMGDKGDINDSAECSCGIGFCGSRESAAFAGKSDRKLSVGKSGPAGRPLAKGFEHQSGRGYGYIEAVGNAQHRDADRGQTARRGRRLARTA